MATSQLPRHYGAYSAPSPAMTTGLGTGASNSASSLRATSAANEAAAAAAAFLGLPTALSPDTRMPWARLPIDSSATVRWQCLRQDVPTRTAAAGTTEEEGIARLSQAKLAWTSALHALRQHSMEEAIGNASSSARSLRHDLASANIWTSLTSTSSSAATASTSTSRQLWFFDIDVASSSAESINQGTRQARDAAQKELQGSGVNVTVEEGSWKLSEAYKSVSNGSDTSLVPGVKERIPLRYLLRALEDIFLRRWIYSQEHQSQRVATEPSTADSITHAGDKSAVAVVSAKNHSDDEEGALHSQSNAEGIYNVTQDASIYQATQIAGQRRISRLGRGVMVAAKPSTTPSIYMLTDCGQDKIPLHCGLRCFCSDLGEIHLYTYARDMKLLPCLATDEDIDVVLAPTRNRARLNGIRRVPTTNTIDPLDLAPGARKRLLESLRLDVAIIDDTSDDWALCTDIDGNDFLWPATLCLKERDTAGVKHAQTGTDAFTRFTATEGVGTEAVDLVREAVGIMPMAVEADDNDAMTEDDSESVPEESSNPRDESNGAVKDEADIQASATDGIANPKQEEPASVQKEGAENTAAASTSVLPARRLSAARPSSSGKLIGPPDSMSRRPSRGNEDDLDLWGSFGFGEAEDVTMRAQPSSRDGLEDSGFGLVTEDDFSFFDDAGAAFADFDIPSMPVITEEADDTIMQSSDGRNGDAAEGNGDAFAMTRQTSQDDGDSNGHSGHSAGQTMTDPPSLPAFTPGSFSTNSPTVGGISNKTPRTPYSPNQDLADMNVRVEGDDELRYGDHELASDGNGVIARDLIGHPAALHDSTTHSSDPNSAPDETNAEGHSRHLWMLGQRRGIKSKYQGGKYAMPDVTHFERSSSAGSEDRQQSSKLQNSRDRMRPRHLIQNMADLQKFRLGGMRADDLGSDFTEDEIMSDRSSRHGQDSDDETSTSEDGEDHGGVEQDKWFNTLYQAAALVLNEGKPTDEPQQSQATDPPPIAETSNGKLGALTDEKVQGVLIHMVDCQYMRRQARKAKQSSVSICMASTHLDDLFVPFAGAEVEELAVGKSMKGGHVYLMDPPRLITGSQDSVVSITPVALPFWHKLKLQAVNGPKHIVAFGLYSGKLAVPKQSVFREWFANLSQQFVESGLGTHSLAQDGVLNLGGTKQRSISQVLDHMVTDDEQWSDTLASLLSRFTQDLLAHRSIVLYAICQDSDPVVPQGWSVSKLEQDLRKLAVQRFGALPQLIAVRYVSYDVICSPRMTQNDPSCDIARFAMSVYDSTPTALLPSYNAEAHLPAYKTDPIGAFTPRFTVLPSSSRVLGASQLFELDWKAESLNMLAQGNSLHFAYHLASAPKQISVLTMMDEQGNEHAVIGWRRALQSTLADEIRRIWQAITQHSRRVRMLWRVIICKNRPMDEAEADAWNEVLRQWSSGRDARSYDHILDVTLTCADVNSPLSLAVGQRDKNAKGAASVGTPSAQAASLNETKGGQAGKVPTDNVLVDPLRAQHLLLPSARVGMPTMSDEECEILLPLKSACLLTVPQMWSGAAPIRQEGSTSGTVLQNNGTSSTHSLWVHVIQIHVRSPSAAADNKGDVQATVSGPKTPSLESRLLRIMHQFQALELVARERALLHLDDVSRHLPWHLGILAALEGSVVPTLEAM